MTRYRRYSSDHDRPRNWYEPGRSFPAPPPAPWAAGPLPYGSGFSPGAYGHADPYRGGAGAPYDWNAKSQWQRDHGDPYNDRQHHTPVRVVRGDYDSEARYPRSMRYDRGAFGPYYGSARYDRGWRW